MRAIQFGAKHFVVGFDDGLDAHMDCKIRGKTVFAGTQVHVPAKPFYKAGSVASNKSW